MITLDDLRFMDALDPHRITQRGRPFTQCYAARTLDAAQETGALGWASTSWCAARATCGSPARASVSWRRRGACLSRSTPCLTRSPERGAAWPAPCTSCPSFGFGRIHVAPLIARFADAYPSVRVTLDLSEKPWTESKTADVVIHIGTVRDLSWVAHLLARNARWLCASPAYLRRRGVPSHPRDLLGHACLCVRENDEDVTLWRYRNAGRNAPGARSCRCDPRHPGVHQQRRRGRSKLGAGRTWCHLAVGMGRGAVRGDAANCSAS